jgi:biotin synthase
MNEQMQALCFLAGANSIFYGEKLLTTPLPEESADLALFAKLGLNPEQLHTREPAALKPHLQETPREQNALFYPVQQNLLTETLN